MKRAGFTMIELIFVIVILGILAAVAIPKLAATRDDAKIASGASGLATTVTDIGSYYTANGNFSTLETMSNAYAGVSTDFNSSTVVSGVAFPDAACITIGAELSTNATATDSINLKYIHANATTICKGIATASANLFGQSSGWVPSADVNQTHTFGGNRVSF